LIKSKLIKNGRIFIKTISNMKDDLYLYEDDDINEEEDLDLNDDDADIFSPTDRDDEEEDMELDEY